MATTSILIADDHLLLRETLVLYLDRLPQFHVATAASLPEALQHITATGPFDAMLLDIAMPGMSGSGLDGVTTAVAANAPGAVALMSGTVRREFVKQAIDVGARGYIPKTMAPQALVEAVMQIVGGRVFLPFDLQADQGGPLPGPLAELSPQEVRVLRHLCQGMSNKEIARALAISEVTIKTHMRAICAKLGARNRTHAALIGNAGLGPV